MMGFEKAGWLLASGNLAVFAVICAITVSNPLRRLPKKWPHPLPSLHLQDFTPSVAVLPALQRSAVTIWNMQGLPIPSLETE